MSCKIHEYSDVRVKKNHNERQTEKKVAMHAAIVIRPANAANVRNPGLRSRRAQTAGPREGRSRTRAAWPPAVRSARNARQRARAVGTRMRPQAATARQVDDTLVKEGEESPEEREEQHIRHGPHGAHAIARHDDLAAPKCDGQHDARKERVPGKRSVNGVCGTRTLRTRCRDWSVSRASACGWSRARRAYEPAA